MNSKLSSHTHSPLHPLVRPPMARDGLLGRSQWNAWFLGVMTPPDLRPISRLPEAFATEMCEDFPTGRNWAWYCLNSDGKTLILSDGSPQLFKSNMACALDAIQERLSLAATKRPDANCIPDPREFGVACLSEAGLVNVLAHNFTSGEVYFWPYLYATKRVAYENGVKHSVRKAC